MGEWRAEGGERYMGWGGEELFLNPVVSEGLFFFPFYVSACLKYELHASTHESLDLEGYVGSQKLD